MNNRSRRHFYRPNDRVNYRDFERGNRDSRGRIASNGRNKSYRKNLSNGLDALEELARLLTGVALRTFLSLVLVFAAIIEFCLLEPVVLPLDV